MRSGEEVSALVRLQRIAGQRSELRRNSGAPTTVRRHFREAVWCHVVSPCARQHLMVWMVGLENGFSGTRQLGGFAKLLACLSACHSVAYVPLILLMIPIDHLTGDEWKL